MEKNENIDESFHSYKKSLNHKVEWKKKDNIKICDLNSKCVELKFNINKLSSDSKIFNTLIKKNYNNLTNINNLYHTTNYDIILFFFIIVFIIILKFK